MPVGRNSCVPLKIEIDSALENFMSLLVMLHGLFAVLVSGGMYLAFARFMPEQAMRGVYIIIAVHGGVFFLLLLARMNLRVFYHADPETRRVDLVHEFMGMQKREHFIDFSQIELVTVSGIRKRSGRNQGDRWYSYMVCLLDKSGRMFDFSRENRDLSRQNALAVAFAQTSGCQILNCKKEHVIKVVSQHGIVNVELVSLPLGEFSGQLLPFEGDRQGKNILVIAAAFFMAFFLVVCGTAALLAIFPHI
jgi:hypothetical protein